MRKYTFILNFVIIISFLLISKTALASNSTLYVPLIGLTSVNVARMLSIPFNLESAVMVIKMGNIRSIDMGEILSLKEERVNGEITHEENYFLESVGIGFEADFQKFFLSFSRHHLQSIGQLIKDTRSFYKTPLTIELDNNRTIESKAQIVMISNGPYMGANLSVAPTSKLNTLYKMSKKQLFWHVVILKIANSKFYTYDFKHHPDIQTYTSTIVKISSKKARPVDADARIFGQTPISIKVKPKAIKVIVGFTEFKKESALLEKKIYIGD